jgi:hypothetical protein
VKTVLAVIISVYMLYSKEVFIAQSKKLLFAFLPSGGEKACVSLRWYTPASELYLGQDHRLAHHRGFCAFRHEHFAVPTPF